MSLSNIMTNIMYIDSTSKPLYKSQLLMFWCNVSLWIKE